MIIAIVKLEDSYRWSGRRNLPATCRFAVSMLLAERRFERRYFESGVIVHVPSKY